MDSSKNPLRLLNNAAEQHSIRKRNNLTSAGSQLKESEEFDEEIDSSSEIEDEEVPSSEVDDDEDEDEDEEEENNLGNNENQYSVEAIRSHRGIGANREYFIKWENYPENQNTWEPLEHLQNIKNLVREYEGKIKAQKSSGQSSIKAVSHKLISSDEEDDDDDAVIRNLSLIHLRKKPAAKTVSNDSKKILKQTSIATVKNKKNNQLLKNLSNQQEEVLTKMNRNTAKKADIKISSIKSSLSQQKNSLLAAILNRNSPQIKETTLGVQSIIEQIGNNNNHNKSKSNITKTSTTPLGKRSFAEINLGVPSSSSAVIDNNNPPPPVKKNKLNIIEFQLPSQSTTTATSATPVIKNKYLKSQQQQQQQPSKHLLGLKLQPIVKNTNNTTLLDSSSTTSSIQANNIPNMITVTTQNTQQNEYITPIAQITASSSSTLSSTELRMNILNRLTNDQNQEALGNTSIPSTILPSTQSNSQNIILSDIPDNIIITDPQSLVQTVRSPVMNKDIVQPNPQGFYNILMKKPLGNTIPANTIMSLIAASKQSLQQQQQQQPQQQSQNKLERMLASDPSTFFETQEDSDCEDPTSEAYMLKRQNKELLKILECESEKFKKQFTLSGNNDEDDEEDEEEEKSKSKETNKDKIFDLEKDLVQFNGEEIQTIKDSKALIYEVILRELNQEIFKKSKLASDLISRQQTQKNYFQISYFFPFQFRNKDPSNEQDKQKEQIEQECINQEGNEENKIQEEKDGININEEDKVHEEQEQSTIQGNQIDEEIQEIGEQQQQQQQQQSAEQSSNDSNIQIVPSSSSTAENQSVVEIVDSNINNNNKQENISQQQQYYISSFNNVKYPNNIITDSFATSINNQYYINNTISNENTNSNNNNYINSSMEPYLMNRSEIQVPPLFTSNQLIEQTTQMQQQQQQQLFTPSKLHAGNTITSGLQVGTQNPMLIQPKSPFSSSLKSYLNRQISDTFTMKRITSPMEKESNFAPTPLVFQKRLFQNNFIEQDKIIFSCEEQDVVEIPQDVIRENPANLSIPSVEPAENATFEDKTSPSEIIRDQSIEKERDNSINLKGNITSSYQVSQKISSEQVFITHDDTFMALEESNLIQENVPNSLSYVPSSGIQEDNSTENNNEQIISQLEQTTQKSSESVLQKSNKISKSRSREPSVQQSKAIVAQTNPLKSQSPNTSQSALRDGRLVKTPNVDNSKSPSQTSDKQAKENNPKKQNQNERSRDPSRSQSSKKDIITQGSQKSSSNVRDRSRSSSHFDGLQNNSNSRSQSNCSLNKSKKNNSFNQKAASSQTAPFKEDLKNGVPRKSPNQTKSTGSTNPPVKKLVNPFHRNTIYDEDDEDEQQPQSPQKPAKTHSKHPKKVPEKELPPVIPEPINEDIWDDDEKDICGSSSGNASKFHNSNMIGHNINPYDNNNSLSLQQQQQQQQHSQNDNKSALIKSYFRKESGVNNNSFRNNNNNNINAFYQNNNDYSINDTPSANGFIKNNIMSKNNNKLISSAEESEDYNTERTEEESERESNQSKVTKMLNGSYERQDEQNNQGKDDKNRLQQQNRQSQERLKQQQQQQQQQKQNQQQQQQQQFQSSDEENQRRTETENSRVAEEEDDSDYYEQQGNETPIIESTAQTQLQLFQEKQLKQQLQQLEQQQRQQLEQHEEEEQVEEYKSVIDVTEFQQIHQDNDTKRQEQPTQLTVCEMEMESHSKEDNNNNNIVIQNDLNKTSLSPEEQLEISRKLKEFEEYQETILRQLGEIGCPMLDVPDRITEHIISQGQVFLKVVWKPRENTNIQMPPTFIEFMKVQESYPIIFSQYMLAQLFNKDIFAR